jgi:hypothetical protein
MVARSRRGCRGGEARQTGLSGGACLYHGGPWHLLALLIVDDVRSGARKLVPMASDRCGMRRMWRPSTHGASALLVGNQSPRSHDICTMCEAEGEREAHNRSAVLDRDLGATWLLTKF